MLTTVQRLCFQRDAIVAVAERLHRPLLAEGVLEQMTVSRHCGWSLRPVAVELLERLEGPFIPGRAGAVYVWRARSEDHAEVYVLMVHPHDKPEERAP